MVPGMSSQAESLLVSWFSQDAQGQEGTLSFISGGIATEEGWLGLRLFLVLSGSTIVTK